MISSKGKKIGDVRWGRVPMSRVYAGVRLVWRRMASLYLKVVPQHLWLPEDILQGDVDVLSNTEWVAGVDASLQEPPYLYLDVSQFNVQADGADFDVHVSSNTDWEASLGGHGEDLFLYTDASQVTVPSPGADFVVRVSSNTSWSACVTDGDHSLEVLPPRALLPPRAGATATLQVRCSGQWSVIQ